MNIINNPEKRVTLWPDKVAALQSPKETEIINDLVKKSNRIIASISSHKFPFDLFPDIMNVEEGRVTVIDRNFFFSSNIHSVDIKNISNVLINTTPFFAQLVIVSIIISDKEVKISNLKQEEAIFIRRIIEGLRIFVEKKIDTSVYSKEDLIAKLEELSKTEIVV